tara:strand:+ start:26809 stop:28347 length:1539 start_codon:yes stop_codon:yes gene_type:complete
MTDLHTATTLKYRNTFQALVDAGALVVVNHSGGKDSQAMYALIKSLVPHDQIAVVHADLGNIEWAGVQDHIRATVEHPLHVAHAVYKDGSDKTLLDMVERRHEKLVAEGKDTNPWPDSGSRYCTSDLKRGPCEKVIRRLSEETGRKLIVNCFGFRAEESDQRAKRPTWAFNKRLSKAGRRAWDFSPIHDLKVGEVFSLIASVGQKAHWAYADGNQRLSCVFCVFGSTNDLTHGAKRNPDLYRDYVLAERRFGKTIRKGKTLEEVTGITIDETPTKETEMPTIDKPTIEDLAKDALPFNDDDYGSERQIDAENLFWETVWKLGAKKGLDLSPEGDFGAWCHKATVDEAVPEALKRLAEADHPALDTVIDYRCSGEQSYTGPLRTIIENFADHLDDDLTPTLIASLCDNIEFVGIQCIVGTHDCGQYCISVARDDFIWVARCDDVFGGYGITATARTENAACDALFELYLTKSRDWNEDGMEGYDSFQGLSEGWGVTVRKYKVGEAYFSDHSEA